MQFDFFNSIYHRITVPQEKTISKILISLSSTSLALEILNFLNKVSSIK